MSEQIIQTNKNLPWFVIRAQIRLDIGDRFTVLLGICTYKDRLVGENYFSLASML